MNLSQTIFLIFLSFITLLSGCIESKDNTEKKINNKEVTSPIQSKAIETEMPELINISAMVTSVNTCGALLSGNKNCHGESPLSLNIALVNIQTNQKYIIKSNQKGIANISLSAGVYRIEKNRLFSFTPKQIQVSTTNKKFKLVARAMLR